MFVWGRECPFVVGVLNVHLVGGELVVVVEVLAAVELQVELERRGLS